MIYNGDVPLPETSPFNQDYKNVSTDSHSLPRRRQPADFRHLWYRQMEGTPQPLACARGIAAAVGRPWWQRRCLACHASIPTQDAAQKIPLRGACHHDRSTGSDMRSDLGQDLKVGGKPLHTVELIGCKPAGSFMLIEVQGFGLQRA